MRLTFHLSCVIALLVLLLPTANAFGQGNVAQIHLVVTQKMPKSQRLGKQLTQELAGLKLQTWDMAGRSGASILTKLQNDVSSLDTFITVGAPATKFVAENFPEHSIVAAYALSDALTGVTHDDLHVVESSPSLTQLAKALREVWPEVGTIGAFTTLDEQPDIPGVEFFQVSGPKDVGKVINDRPVDGFVFPRQGALLNRSTIKDVVGELNKSRTPAIGYSKFLVGTGFPAAYVLDERAYGVMVAKRLGELIEVSIEAPPARGTILVSRKLAGKFGISVEHAKTVGELL